MAIRFILADDHPIFLAGLRNLLGTDSHFEFAGDATTGLSALKLARETRPDVAVIDISIPELNGIALARRLRDEVPETRILILTVYEDRAYLNQALDASARGYILKRSAAEILAPAIRAVMVGGVYVDPAITHYVLGQPKRALPGGNENDLSGREEAVLRSAALGFTTKEIAGRLDLGVKSVETYKSRALEKLGLRTRADLVRYAASHGWLAQV